MFRNVYMQGICIIYIYICIYIYMHIYKYNVSLYHLPAVLNPAAGDPLHCRYTHHDQQHPLASVPSSYTYIQCTKMHSQNADLFFFCGFVPFYGSALLFCTTDGSEAMWISILLSNTGMKCFRSVDAQACIVFFWSVDLPYRVPVLKYTRTKIQ